MADKKATGFSKQMTELQKILDWFEGDDFDLDKAEKMFESGSKLVKEMRTKLDKAEQRITNLDS